MATNSHTAKQRAIAKLIKARVIEILNWDELSYGEYVYKSGRAYLQAYIPNDPQGIDSLIESKIYWKWWRNHWMQRDAEFVNEAHDMSVAVRRVRYREIHDPQALAKEIYPNATILSASYSKMIGDFIKTLR
jgi:hypothetical protein